MFIERNLPGSAIDASLKLKTTRERKSAERTGLWAVRLIGRTLASREEGSSLVEIALVSQIMFLFAFGMIAMCLAFYSYSGISEAAREASRYAITHGSTSSAPVTDLTAYVKGLGFLNKSLLGVTTTYLPGPGVAVCAPTPCVNTPGNYVQVTVTYQYAWRVPYMTSKTISMSSSSKMVVVQ